MRKAIGGAILTCLGLAALLGAAQAQAQTSQAWPPQVRLDPPPAQPPRVWGPEGERVQITPADPYADPFSFSLAEGEEPPAPELLEAPAPAPAARMQAGEEAHLRFLDRRTSTRGALVSPVGSTARYGHLIIEVLACHHEIEGEDSAAFLRIRDEGAPQEEGRAPPEAAPIFSGWVFAMSPSLSALDHPRYDVWVAECRTAEESQSAANR